MPAAVTVAALAGCAMSPRTDLVTVSSGQYELTKRSGFLVKQCDVRIRAHPLAADERQCAIAAVDQAVKDDVDRIGPATAVDRLGFTPPPDDADALASIRRTAAG